MKIKGKYQYTKTKKVKFSQQQWAEALAKTLREHPELAGGLTDELKQMADIKIKQDNE